MCDGKNDRDVRQIAQGIAINVQRAEEAKRGEQNLKEEARRIGEGKKKRKDSASNS